MYALILAGGMGERLKPLTNSLPKPMVPLQGKPILWHQVEWLKGAGITDVVFLVGYRWQMVRDYFGDGAEFGIRAGYSIEDAPLGRGGAIRRGFERLPEQEDTLFVLNGDIITAAEPGDVLAGFRGKKLANPAHLATIMVTPMVSPYGLVDFDGNNDVVSFREKAELPCWINAGVYVFDREICGLLPRLGDHEVDTFPKLALEGRISACPTTAFWRSVDSLKDLREAEEFVQRQALPSTGSS